MRSFSALTGVVGCSKRETNKTI